MRWDLLNQVNLYSTLQYCILPYVTRISPERSSIIRSQELRMTSLIMYIYIYTYSVHFHAKRLLTGWLYQPSANMVTKGDRSTLKDPKVIFQRKPRRERQQENA